jgi:MscS family membrane protein
VILSDFGFNVTTLIAGLGIGGIAVALAAQKSIENLFGGLTLFADQPVRIGERCRFADITGTVEDIGLRSIRIRTQERTVVSVPNGDFANLRLENLSRRDKHWFHPVLRLPRDTPVARLRAVLEAMRGLLRSAPGLERGTERAWLARIGDQIEIEISAYVPGTDRERFESIAETLLLRLLELSAAPAADQPAPARLDAVRKTSSDRGASS